MSVYRQDLDVLKGLAILAVVLYHLGILKSGYLAVDLFFVINGFLIVPSVIRQLWNNEFSYFKFLKKRLVRILPLVLLASIVCLGVGSFGLLPDPYEKLADSVIASNVLSENIFSFLNCKNYWNATNDYKPLMHMWFLGILFEFYVVFPLLMMVFNKCIRKKSILTEESYYKKISIFLSVLCGISFLSYINPFMFGLDRNIAEGIRFYWIQNRFFELGLGGLVALNASRLTCLNRFSWQSIASFFCLFGVICIGLATFDIHNLGVHHQVTGVPSEFGNGLLLSSQPLLLLTVLFSCIVVVQDNTKNTVIAAICRNRGLTQLGKMSLSIFVWHQIIVAFYRCYVSNELSVPFVLLYLVAVLVLSWVTWMFVEQKVRDCRASWIAMISAEVLSCAAAFYLFLNAGVIRPVPELDIPDIQYAHRNMHPEYCDRIFKYDKDFPEADGLPNVLVIGSSFARDFSNVLLESSYGEKIHLSYIYVGYLPNLKPNSTVISRIQKSDYIFVTSGKADVPDYLWENVRDKSKVYGLGTKNFGQNNGTIYIHRNEPWYFDQTVEANPDYDAVNAEWREQWGTDHYFDFIEAARTDDNRIRVFTPDHKFITQDCSHLTRGGAQFYAGVFDFDRVFNNR